MDYHLDRGILFSEEEDHKSLYKWSLQETASAKQPVGGKMVPWQWGLSFYASELELTEFIEKENPWDWDGENPKTQAAEVREGSRIYCTLYPGDVHFSMFGTNRAIEKFNLTIICGNENLKQPEMLVSGGVSYTAEVDFRATMNIHFF